MSADELVGFAVRIRLCDGGAVVRGRGALL
jgi:hypothetical protein